MSSGDKRACAPRRPLGTCRSGPTDGLGPGGARMARYLARRLLQAVVVLWAAYTVSFLVLYALPADPVQLLAGADASDVSQQQLDALREELGLDQPLIVQYVTQLGDA